MNAIGKDQLRWFQCSLRALLLGTVSTAIALSLHLRFVSGIHQDPAKVITAPTIQNPATLHAALSNPDVVLHLDVDWSAHAILSRPVILQLKEALAGDPQLQHVVLRRIDCTEQEGDLWDAVRESLHVDDAMTAGGGAIVWIRSGKVIDCVTNAADAGVDQLVARALQAFHGN